MEWNQQTLEFLSQCFLDTLSDQSELRVRANKNLSDASDKPNYGPSVLRLIAEPSIDEQIRQCAAYNFRFHIRERWNPLSSDIPNIPDAEKEQIKQLIFSSRTTLASLSDTIAVGIRCDLLPELKSSLANAINVNDFAYVNVILYTLNNMFKLFRYRFKCRYDPILLDELKYCSENFGAPLLSFMESLSVKINDATVAGSAETLSLLIQAHRYCCRIFFSLTYLDLPEFFKDNADKWMNEFKKCLTLRYPFVEDAEEKDDHGPALVDDLRTSVFDIIRHHMKHDMFQKYLNVFVEAFWSIPVISDTQIGEELIMTIIFFLIDVNSEFPHVLFSGDLKNYIQILDILLTPDIWKKYSKYTALIDLIDFTQSFMKHARNDQLNTKEKVRHVVGSLLTFVSSKGMEEHGFNYLKQLIENIGYDFMAEHMIHIWASLFTGLPNKTSNFVSHLIIFMSHFLVKHGIQTLVDSINSVEENLFLEILRKYWVPNLKTVYWYKDVKLCAIAATKLLCESPILLDPASEELWGKLLNGLVSLFSKLEDSNKLYNDEDPLKEIIDPIHYSVGLLANLSSQFHGKFPRAIDIYLSHHNQVALSQLCNNFYNLNIE